VAEKEFYSFNEALDELRLKEEELKRLVSEGEIRAFREGETMKLRKADVETLKRQLLGSGEVDVASSTGEELVFEDDAEMQDEGMQTQEISEMETLLDEDVAEVVEPAAAAAAPAVRARAVAVEPASEGLAMRALLVLTSVVLLLAIPITLAVSTGRASELSKGIAGVFGQGEKLK
jgi:excisionase family DNA binding protein